VSDAAAQRRARQTVVNLALSLLATIGLVVAIVLIVPRDDTSLIQRIDFVAVAKDAVRVSNEAIVVPDLPEGWWSNKAEWSANPVDAVPAFTAGFVGPKNEYIGMIQGFNANPTWLALKLKDVELTGGLPVGYRTWDIYTSKVVHDPAESMDYIMVMTVNTDDFVLLFGNAAQQDFEYLATSIDSKLMKVKPVE